MTNIKNKKNKNSAWDVFSSIATTVLLIVSFAIMLVTLISSKVLKNNTETYLFGYKPYIVNTQSMEGSFDAGDIIVIKKVNINEISEGDIITFHSIDPTNYYEVLTHRVVGITTYDGTTAFVTKGDANEDVDTYPAVANNITGRYAFKIKKAGYFFDFLKTPAGYVCCILLPFIFLFVVQGANIFKISKDKKKEVEKQRQEEKEKMEEAHQSEMDAMRKQIEALQDKLNQKNDDQ